LREYFTWVGKSSCPAPDLAYLGGVPNYDYRCETCGHQFEVFQSMKDDKLTDCPVDGCVGPIKRLLGTGAGIIFKGGGFYQTDYRSESYKKGAKRESESMKPKEEKSDSGGAKAKSTDQKSE
jgi:putative FmdB family regulatory protein